MAFFDHVQRCSFAGVEFPVQGIDVNGGLRDHVHEFPHADGGAPEKLGRKLYTIRIRAIFDEGIGLLYPDLYPDSLWKLRTLFESGLTDDLVLPNLGTIKAYARNWPQRWDAAVRSGETAEFEFGEDPHVTNIGVFNLETVPDAATMFVQLDHLNQEAAASQLRHADHLASLPPGGSLDLSQCSIINPSLLSSFSSSFSALIALRDAETLYGTLLEAKVESVVRGAELLDSAITSPFDAHLLYAIQDMVQSAQWFEKNARSTTAPIKNYVVPRYMSVSAIAVAIYGDTSRAMELLQMNPIEDAYRVAPQTVIAYVDSTPSVGSMSLGNARPFVSS